jgi:hypothetical protein
MKQDGIALVAAALGIACATAPQLQSQRPAPGIAVDGSYAEWSGRLVRIDEERSVAVAVANDDQNLYLCLVTRDLDVQTLIERLGFTLWVDPQGGTRRQIGFRVAPFQAGAQATAPAYVEIVQHGAEYGEQLVGSTAGPIDVKAAARADVIAYEIRIALETPLSGSSGQSGITLAPGERVGLGFETDALTSRRRTRVPAQQEPQPGPGYEDSEAPPPEPPRARKIAPLHAWVVAQLATHGSGAR